MKQPLCELCGEPMPEGEEMFKFHGYSGPCPKPPLASPEYIASALAKAYGPDTRERKALARQREQCITERIRTSPAHTPPSRRVETRIPTTGTIPPAGAWGAS